MEPTPLVNRSTVMAEIRRLVSDDPWLALWALNAALDHLDLRQLNEVLDSALGAQVGVRYSDRGLWAKLRAERWQ